jgi:hypothetical protein
MEPLEEEIKPRKVSFLEKLTVLFFFVLPLFFVIFVRRISSWTVKHRDNLITFNLVLVVILAGMLVALRIWLTHVRGW